MNEQPIQVAFARRMRREPTPSEDILWQALRRNQLNGHQFRRQHPIPSTRFIADFYCKTLKLIVEIDGGYHDHPDQKERDRERETLITEFGYTIIRFTDQQVIKELPEVLKAIRDRSQILIREQNSRYRYTPLSSERVRATP